MRPQLAGGLEGLGAAGGDDGLKPVLVAQFQQEPGEVHVVLDDEQHAVAVLDVGAVVRDGRTSAGGGGQRLLRVGNHARGG